MFTELLTAHKKLIDSHHLKSRTLPTGIILYQHIEADIYRPPSSNELSGMKIFLFSSRGSLVCRYIFVRQWASASWTWIQWPQLVTNVICICNDYYLKAEPQTLPIFNGSEIVSILDGYNSDCPCGSQCHCHGDPDEFVQSWNARVQTIWYW